MHKRTLGRKTGAAPALRLVFSVVALLAIASAAVPWYAARLADDSLRYAELGDQVHALHAAQESVFLDPLSTNGRFVLAGSQQRLGREGEARSTLEQAVLMEPRNYLVWEQLAIYERDNWGQPELARLHFARGLSLDPQDRQLQIVAGG